MRLLEPWPLSDLRSSDEIRQILDPDGTGGSWPGEAFGWLIDVNGDESPDYEVSVHDGGDEILARVFHVATPWDDVCGASASFDGVLHTVTIAPSCIGSPDAISVMGYAQRFKRLEGPADYQYGFGTAPGSGMAPQWSGPIPAPGSSTAATAQSPDPVVPNLYDAASPATGPGCPGPSRTPREKTATQR